MHHQFSRAFALAAVGTALPAVVAAQSAVTVSGRVTSDAGQPLASATVFIQALNLGATTSDDGRYQFTVPGARATGQTVTITARRVGFRTASAQITLGAGAVAQNFALPTNALQLGQVVVTGAGLTTTAERLGSVRTQIDTNALVRATEPNVAQALAAKAPGVVVTAQSGDPGASSKIVIRGLNTIQGTGNPLFVVDGVPINNETISTAGGGSAQGSGTTTGTVSTNRAYDLNPDDIANVEVLKSAAAAAIYGARASQGVILITTKRGRAGATRYSLRSTGTVDQINRTVPLQRSYGQGTANVTQVCRSMNCQLTGSSYGAAIPTGTPTFDHSRDMFENGSLFDNVAQVSGGGERTTFFLSAGSSRQNGMVVGDKDYFRRQTFRANATQQIISGLTATGSFNFVDSRGSFTQRGSNTSGITLGGWRTTPTFDNRQYLDTLYGLQRSYRFPNPGSNSGTSSRLYDNPFFVINSQDNRSTVGRSLGNINLSYAPVSWFNVSYQLGGDYTNDERIEAIPKTSSDQSTGRVRRANYTTYISDQLINAQGTKGWRDGVETRLAIGAEYNSQRFQQNQIRGNDLIADQPLVITNTVTQVPEGGGDFRSLIRRESYFAQLQQQLFTDLFITGTIRNDGFSTFGSSNRRNFFPSGQASYVFTNIFNAGGVLSDGKLRVAYGQTGTEPGVYLTNGFYSGGFLVLGGFGDQLLAVQNGQGGLTTSAQLAQPNLRPERQNEFETGFDVGLFRNRADFSFTIYNRIARDVIFSAPLPPTSGFGVQARNAGKIQNRGIELSTNIRAYRTKDVDLSLGLQYARNKNRVVSLLGSTAVDLPTGGFFTGTLVSAVAPDSITGQSYSLGVFRSYDFQRCGVTAELAGNAACQGVAKGTMYIGAGGFPLQDQQLRVIGDPNPTWTGAVRPAVRYKGLNITGLVDIRHGGVVWNGTKGALYNFGTHKDTEIRADCTGYPRKDCTGNMRVFGTNYTPGRSQTDPGTFPVAGPGAGKAVPIGQNWFQQLGSGFFPVSSQFMESGSFAKLREVSLAYSFTQPAIRRAIGFSSIDARVAGRNLALGTNYTGVDPETNLGGAAVGAQGVDYFNNPNTRSYVFTISLNR